MPAFIAFKGTGTKIPYKKLMHARPVRNSSVEWDRMNADVIKCYMPCKKTYFMKLLGKFIDIPDERSFRFNPLGSLVWELCDGNNTVEDIKEKVLKRSKGNEKDIEKRLLKFINRLLKHDLITLELS